MAKNVKRVVMKLDEIRRESDLNWRDPEAVATAGICALVDVENMGWCRDRVTRWYHFTNENGDPAVYYKHQLIYMPERAFFI